MIETVSKDDPVALPQSRKNAKWRDKIRNGGNIHAAF
jgi:hypothetical protein